MENKENLVWRKGIPGRASERYARAAGMTPEEWREATRFSAIDVGWIIMCVGMSLGAGIVFLPIQVGLSGLPVFLLVALLGYPIAYAHQKLYLDVLAKSELCEDFAGIISGYLGKKLGLFLRCRLFCLYDDPALSLFDGPD